MLCSGKTPKKPRHCWRLTWVGGGTINLSNNVSNRTKSHFWDTLRNHGRANWGGKGQREEIKEVGKKQKFFEGDAGPRFKRGSGQRGPRIRSGRGPQQRKRSWTVRLGVGRERQFDCLPCWGVFDVTGDCSVKNKAVVKRRLKGEKSNGCVPWSVKQPRRLRKTHVRKHFLPNGIRSGASQPGRGLTEGDRPCMWEGLEISRRMGKENIRAKMEYPGRNKNTAGRLSMGVKEDILQDRDLVN